MLLVDLDPQGNATMGCGIDKNRLSQTVYHLLLGMAAVEAVLIPAPSCHCHIVPANRELAGAEVELVSIDDREHRLQRALKQVGELASVIDFENAMFVGTRDLVVQKHQNPVLRGWRLELFAFLYRNSVKVVINAYSGKTTFYNVDPADPILRAYEAAFPNMFTPLSKMSAGFSPCTSCSRREMAFAPASEAGAKNAARQSATRPANPSG